MPKKVGVERVKSFSETPQLTRAVLLYNFMVVSPKGQAFHLTQWTAAASPACLFAVQSIQAVREEVRNATEYPDGRRNGRAVDDVVTGAGIVVPVVVGQQPEVDHDQ